MFRRGDSNSDRSVDLSDAIHTLGFLFGGGDSELTCPDASDVNDSGDVDVSDPIALLGFLFQNGTLPQPGLECGTDPTADSLGCQAVFACAVAAEAWKSKKSLEDDGFTCVPQIGGENVCSKCDAQGHCVTWKCNAAGQCIEILPANLDGDPLWVENFALHATQKMVGDFDGDGRDDIVAFMKNSGPVAGNNDVLVGLSNGVDAFMPAVVWHSSFAANGDECLTGDIDGDGRDDIVAVEADGAVAVAFSERNRFSQTIGQNVDFRVLGDEFLMGDVNRDGRDDLIILTKDTREGAARGDVWVALSRGVRFDEPDLWHGAVAANGEQCRVGDFDGNGTADLAVFATDGSVDIVLSNGASFFSTQRLSPGFSSGVHPSDVADMNRDGKVDVVGIGADGSVEVALSSGADFDSVVVAEDLHCENGAGCRVGDPNGDGFRDMIEFVLFTTSHQTAGDVFVFLSGGLPEIDDGGSGGVPGGVGPGPSPGPIVQ